MEWIQRLGLLHSSDTALDVGCGAGAMAWQFAQLSTWHGNYVGFDVHAPSVRWCQKKFWNDSRFRFSFAPIASAFGGAGLPIEDYRFPLADGQADLVVAKSVFTHLLEAETRAYLREIQRVLARGRAALVTAFLFDPDSETGCGRSRFFACRKDDPSIRYRRRSRPEAAVAFERARFAGMIEDARLRIIWFCPGFWPGNDSRPRGQDILVIGH